MEQLHRCELEILLLLQKICVEHGLTYYLTAGSLLGAVRHEGFIPWDDDIDVVMPRRDYTKFCKIANQLLGQDYFLQNYKTDKNFPFYFTKIRKQNTHVEEEIFLDVDINKGIYIDIFPLDFCPKNSLGAKIFFKSIEFLTFVSLSKVSESYQVGYSKKLAKILVAIFRLFPTSLLYFFREILVYFVRYTESGDSLCTVGGTHGYPHECYLSFWFETSTELIFEGVYFPVPSQWDELLTSMYGNYMEFPSEQNRKGHFIKEE